jgi:hypothetical protein
VLSHKIAFEPRSADENSIRACRYLYPPKALVFSDRLRSDSLNPSWEADGMRIAEAMRARRWNPSLSHRCFRMRTKDGSRIVREMPGLVFSLGPWLVCAPDTFRWDSSLNSTRPLYEHFMRRALPEIGYPQNKPPSNVVRHSSDSPHQSGQ